MTALPDDQTSSVFKSSPLGRRHVSKNLMLFVSNWPANVGDDLKATLTTLLGDELLELKNVRAGTVLSKPEDDKPAGLIQVQKGAYVAISVPEFDGRPTMKALEGWMVACAGGATKLADITGPTFLIVEPSADGKTAVLAWEYTKVCPSSSGQQDVSFHHDRMDDVESSYELNLLGDVNPDILSVLLRAQVALDEYNNPTAEA